MNPMRACQHRRFVAGRYLTRLTEEENEANGDVRFSPPRGRERGANVRDLCPIEGDEGHALDACVRLTS